MAGRRPALLASMLLSAASASAQDADLAAQGYLGLTLRDLADGGTVVSWVLPGPLAGRGLESGAFDLARPDLVVAVDGNAMQAEAFRDYVRSRAPGTTVCIEYRRSRARGGTIPSGIDHEEEVLALTVELASRDAWTGTIGRARSIDGEMRLDGPPLLDPGDPSNVLGAALAEHDLAEPLDRLLGVFTTFRDEAPDFHALSRVRAGFAHPFRLAEIAEAVVAPARGAPGDPLAAALALARENLDLDEPAPADDEPPGDRVQAVRAACAALARECRAALGPLADREPFARQALDLLRVPQRTFYIEGEHAREHIAVIRSSMQVDFDRLVGALAFAGPLIALAREDLPDAGPVAVPDALGGAVTGPILAADDLGPGIGWLVVGSGADNRYDLARVAFVVDPGGDDAYTASDACLGARAIVDLAGDDAYTGTAEHGPASALLGVTLVDDRAGDDRYEGDLLAAGAACFGAALLLDRGGNDVYAGGAWSLGAACYGAGLIVDLGGGADTYLGAFLCQGVGGPRGLGAIVDGGGRDLYRANGPVPSAYGTPAVYQSFSQGIGFGYRQYAAGGVGLLCDLGGDDRYEAGEFAQGGGYYHALGVLYDASGRDLYYGNRYGQGFGVHQAHGALVDEAGDDTYWSMTAASQGAAWDVGAGLLLERAGNDTYQCDGLGQGGASQQAIAMLVDLAGRDRYAAGGGATQGQSGGNTYHFTRTGAFSFSLLLDLGGGADLYARPRPNDAVTVTGARNEDDPSRSGLHGVVIDR